MGKKNGAKPTVDPLDEVTVVKNSSEPQYRLIRNMRKLRSEFPGYDARIADLMEKELSDPTVAKSWGGQKRYIEIIRWGLTAPSALTQPSQPSHPVEPIPTPIRVLPGPINAVPIKKTPATQLSLPEAKPIPRLSPEVVQDEYRNERLAIGDIRQSLHEELMPPLIDELKLPVTPRLYKAGKLNIVTMFTMRSEAKRANLNAQVNETSLSKNLEYSLPCLIIEQRRGKPEDLPSIAEGEQRWVWFLEAFDGLHIRYFGSDTVTNAPLPEYSAFYRIKDGQVEALSKSQFIDSATKAGIRLNPALSRERTKHRVAAF